MEILVWLLLLPIMVIIRAIVVGSPLLASGLADAEHALTSAEDKYKERLNELNNPTSNT